uniref:hypothetical protein n=1 Tax=Candidatus Magnetaquicoccus inordinatus TaxID=2496818 RepID=UPI00187D4BDC
SLKEKRNFLVSVGVGGIFNADDVPSNTLEYPVPHNNYTNIGTRQKGNEMVLFGRYGIELAEQSGFFINAIGGISTSTRVELARSNVTGWYYEQKSDDEINPLIGAGFSYFPENSSLSLHLDYDIRRGVSAGLGLKW